MKAPWSDHPWQRALVYGLGLSGRAAATLLLARGVEVLGVDGRPAAELELTDLAGRDGFELAAGAEPEGLPAAVDGVVLSPGVPADRPLVAEARRRGLPVIAEVELAFPFLDGSVVAITGSNGKSTTTALTGAMLAAAGRRVEVCGNIGVPLSSVVDGAAGRTFVVELSSFQLETTVTFAPRAAALLNLAADHLDRYPSLAAYGAAKERIFERQSAADVAVLSGDDPALAAVAPAARRRTFSHRGAVEDGCFLDGETVMEVAPGAAPRPLFARGDLQIAGLHNLDNAMAAALLAVALNAEPAALATALRGFTGLPHRMQKVAEAGGVAFYDDSKGTNPAATVRSLEGFADGTVHLILGGRGKGTDFSELAAPVAAKARRLYLIGETAGELESVLGTAAPAEHCGTLEVAVERAAATARAGEVVLLSPACASFDQFTNFAHRGEVFTRLVTRLSGVRTGGAHGQEARV